MHQSKGVQARLTKLLRLIMVVYLVISVAYTTHSLVLGEGAARTKEHFTNDGSSQLDSAEFYLSSNEAKSLFDSLYPSFKKSSSSRTTAATTGTASSSNWLDSIDQSLILKKTFADALQPSNIIPYYHKATGAGHLWDENDITVTTIVTENRFHALSTLVEKYQGPISVSVHIPSQEPGKSSTLQALDNTISASPLFSTYVDVHLIVSPFERQFNLWRNIARFFSRSKYVMMLDVDFYLCTDFREAVRGSKGVMDLLESGTAALVVPAFEYEKQVDGLDPSTFPTNKQDLLSLVDRNKIDVFHKSWKPGHSSTDYAKYYAAQPGEVYKVLKYQHAYEPYVIFKKDSAPWCDERFVGYGSNKAACLFEIYISGIDYYVLADDFIIHKSHPYEEKTRAEERKSNKQLYTNYRKEMCNKYLNQFLEAGLLESPKAQPMLVECAKIKGFSEQAQEFIAMASTSPALSPVSSPATPDTVLSTTATSHTLASADETVNLLVIDLVNSEDDETIADPVQVARRR